MSAANGSSETRSRRGKAAGRGVARQKGCPFPDSKIDHAQMQADVETCEALMRHLDSCDDCQNVEVSESGVPKHEQLCPTGGELWKGVQQAEARAKRGWRRQSGKEKAKC
jgi:hypothetical protein